MWIFLCLFIVYAYLSIWEAGCTARTHTCTQRSERFLPLKLSPFCFLTKHEHIILGGKQAPGICLSLSPILELHTAHATCLTEYGCLGFGLRASCWHNKCVPVSNCWFCILKTDLRGLRMPLYLVYCLCCGIGQDLSCFVLFFSIFIEACIWLI